MTAAPLTHLLVSREYPPAAYPAGGIGAYVHHIAHLLADRGETVHVLAQLWDGAPNPLTTSHNGRLHVHRIPLETPVSSAPDAARILRLLIASDCPSQVFAWQAAHFIEHLLASESIDVIEAQEWEAPLYFFQLLRQLGLGPSPQPPCIIHLHSPSRMIFEHNAWDATFTDFLPLTRMEEFSIRFADQLLCPSHYLANQVAASVQLDPAAIAVIRYPMGDTPVLDRAAAAWSSDSIAYVGRLELRKGVVEWVDAAVQVAAARPSARFHFFGADTSLHGGLTGSVHRLLLDRIPSALRPRFLFHGARPRSELRKALAELSLAVVPSRWDNLPFTCIEAMATGLPVIASPNGGMAELLTDGESGWIAEDGSVASLAAVLLRALDTPADRRRAMGHEAAATVRRICANDVILDQHLALRRRLAAVPRPCPVKQAAPPTLISIPTTPGARISPDLLPSANAAFAANPRLGLLSSWVLEEGRHSHLCTGPVPPSPADALPTDLQPGTLLHPELFASWQQASPALDPSALWPLLTVGKWQALTYPSPLVTIPAPVHRPTRRFSVMVLAQGGSPRFALIWLAAAPWREKLAWLSRTFANPGRVLRRLFRRSSSS